MRRSDASGLLVLALHISRVNNKVAIALRADSPSEETLMVARRDVLDLLTELVKGPRGALPVEAKAAAAAATVAFGEIAVRRQARRIETGSNLPAALRATSLFLIRVQSWASETASDALEERPIDESLASV